MRLEKSVCRSDNLSEDQIWAICRQHFDPYSKPHPAIGRGAAKASVVYAESLSFDADGKPYAEHANIIGWYEIANMPDREMKHFWMEKAQRMAQYFKYFPRP